MTAAREHGIKRPARPGRALRVCHLAYTFYETDNRVIRYARAAADRGDDVEVIALRRPGQQYIGHEGGVRVIRLQRRTKTEGKPWTYLLKIVSFMARALVLLGARHLRKPYDIIHVHNVPDFLIFSALIPKLTGASLILDIHDILPELYAGKFRVTAESRLFRGLLLAELLSCRFADWVIVANHIWHERLIRRAVPAQKCVTILNYPDLRVFKPRPVDAGAREGPFIILYPGSLSRHQGLDLAIRAFAAVKDRLQNAEFHIYGEGPARPELIDLARELGVGGSVKFRDPLPVDEIAKVMRSAAVGVEPKRSRGFSNEALSTKILEFLASGVPVIVSRTQVHAHYFDDNVVRFFAPDDEDALAQALLALYNTPPDTSYLQRAQEFAEGYGWQRRVGDYYSLLDSLSGSAAAYDVMAGQDVR